MDNNCPAEKVTLAKNQIKRENFDEEIKEYAETAMNELLGWYGYGTAKDDMKSTGTCQSNSNSNSSGPPSPHSSDGCGWCGKPVEDKTGISAGSLSFCSELCFSQSRRANFKKNKTCDWCRHVRHTVSYVDFQDGASQLQFCSDKCLNQYKMHIFCRETRAHLEMHPHIPMENSGTGLITPDLWLKNCKSPDRNTPSPPSSPKPDLLPQTSPLPLITVAHPSKLLAPSMESIEHHKRKRPPIQRRPRKRCPSTITSPAFGKPNDLPQDLRIRHSSPSPLFDNHHLRENFERLTRPNHEPFAPDVRIPPPHLFNHQNLPNFPPIRLPPPPKPPAHGVLPPVTVLVPYPILIPVPMPIPIPLPLQSFLDAESTRNKERNDIPTSSQEQPTEQPLNLESEKANNKSNNQNNQNGEHQAETAIEEVVDDCDLSKNGVTRHLRKRKRVVEPRNKIILKSKKPLSA